MVPSYLALILGFDFFWKYKFVLPGCTKQNPNFTFSCFISYPDSKIHGANMGPTRVLSAPDGLHVGPMNLAIPEVPVHSCAQSIEP